MAVESKFGMSPAWRGAVGWAPCILCWSGGRSLTALAVVTSPTHIGVLNDAFRPKPILILQQTKDPDSPGNRGVGEEPRMIYATTSATKYLVAIERANHFGYTDAICLQEPRDNPADISQADQQRIAKAYLTAFFRRYLTGATELDDYLIGIRPVEELGPFAISVEAET